MYNDKMGKVLHTEGTSTFYASGARGEVPISNGRGGYLDRGYYADNGQGVHGPFPSRAKARTFAHPGPGRVSKQYLIEGYVYEKGLELLASSPVDRRSYADAPGLSFTEIRKYNWPRTNSKKLYDTTIYVGVYADGTYEALVREADIQATKQWSI